MDAIFYNRQHVGRRIFWPCLPFSVLALLLLNLFSFQAFSQQPSYNLDQAENGGKPSSKPISAIVRVDPVHWTNNNLGGTGSHFNESHSVPYRVICENLAENTSYVIRIGFDVRDGGKYALDYITGPQNLSPHGFFPHAEEAVKPLENPTIAGIPTNTAFNTFAIPAINYGNAAQNAILTGSFNALAAQTLAGAIGTKKQLVIYNGTITFAQYQAPGVVDLAAVAHLEAVMLVRFTTGAFITGSNNEKVVIAWGGHIASSVDWGPGGSASSINGSPYHTRIKGFALDNVQHSNDFTEDGGSSDRSLKTDAVFVAPPLCPTLTANSVCIETTSIVFPYTTEAGVTYKWSLSNNTAGAKIQGEDPVTHVFTTTTSPVTIVPSGSSFTAGSFTLNLTMSKAGTADITCPAYTNIGTVTDVSVDAQDADNTLQINLNNSTSTLLGIQSISPGTTANYSFEWKLVSSPFGGNSSFTNLNSPAAGNATFNILSPFAQGDYVVRVIATQLAAPFCKDSSDVTIVVSGGVDCIVKGPSTVCPGAQDNVYFYDANNDGVADPIPGDFNAAWTFDGAHPSAEFDGSTTGSSVKVDVAALGSSCGTSYTIKLTLTSKQGSTTNNCSKTTSVVDETKPVLSGCPGDIIVDFCSIPAPAAVTATDNCPTGGTPVIVVFTETQSNQGNGCSNTITRKWEATDLCGNKESCTQVITVADQDDPLITCPPNVSVKCADKSDPAKVGAPFVSDNCGIKSVTSVDGPVSNNQFIRTWTVEDNAGNTASCQQTITLLDNCAQTLTGASGQTSGAVSSATTDKAAIAEKKAIASDLQVVAHPNPFTSTISFRFSSPVSGRAILEVYNTLGQKIGIVYDGAIKAGDVKYVQYEANKTSKATLIYKLRVNDKSANGKIVQMK
jgi:hypothetical protein